MEGLARYDNGLCDVIDLPLTATSPYLTSLNMVSYFASLSTFVLHIPVVFLPRQAGTIPSIHPSSRGCNIKGCRSVCNISWTLFPSQKNQSEELDLIQTGFVFVISGPLSARATPTFEYQLAAHTAGHYAD